MSPVDLTYGTAGIRQRNYRVWMQFADNTDWQPAVEAIDDLHGSIVADSGIPEKLAALKTKMLRVGECRADSIEVTLEDGEDIMGNEVGKIVLDKTGRFSAELINATPENINYLAGKDTVECIVMLEEINDNRLVEYPDGAMLLTNELIFICNMPVINSGATSGVGYAFNFAENDRGSGISTVTMSTEKSVASTSAFRYVADAHEDALSPMYTIVANSYSHDSSSKTGKIQITSDGLQVHPDITHVCSEISDSSTFDTILVTKLANRPVASTSLIVIHDENDKNIEYSHSYYVRIYGVTAGGINKTGYSESMQFKIS